jgi:hypothetical protein
LILSIVSFERGFFNQFYQHLVKADPSNVFGVFWRHKLFGLLQSHQNVLSPCEFDDTPWSNRIFGAKLGFRETS